MRKNPSEHASRMTRSSARRGRASALRLEWLEERTLPTVTFKPFLMPDGTPPASSHILADHAIGDLRSPMFTTPRAVDPVLSVSDRDPGNIAVASQYGLRLSPYDGTTFLPPTPRLFPNTGSDSFDSTTVFDSTGRLFWAATDTNTGRILVVQLNPSTGAILSGPVVVASTPTGSTDTQAFLAADGDGNLYLAWTRVTGTATAIYVSRSAGGTTWLASPILVSATTEGTVGPASVSIGPAGDVFVAYHSQTGILPNGNPDGVSGKTYVAHFDTLLSQPPMKNLAFTAGLSDITYNIQTTAGRQIPGTHFFTQGATRPVVLADAHRPGQVYVVADGDPTHATGAPYARVFIARSLDNGQTWSATPAPITPAGGSDFQLFPAAAIDRFGDIVVAWYSNHDNLSVPNAAPFPAGTHFLLDVFATYSGDAGLHWTPQYQVNDPMGHFDPDLAAPILIAGMNPTSSTGDHLGLGVFAATGFVAWDSNGVDAMNHPIQQVTTNAFPIRGGVQVDADEGQATNPTLKLDSMVGNEEFAEIVVNGSNREFAGFWQALQGDITPDLASGGVRLEGMFGNYTVNIENTYSARVGSSTITVNTDVNLGGGSDTVNISPAANNLANIRGPVTIHGGGGTNTLNVTDQSNPRDMTFTMEPATLAAAPAGNAFTATINYTGMDNVIVTGGPGVNTFNIHGTPNNIQTTVNAGIGDDTITVGSATHTLDTFQGLLTLNGQAGIDDLEIDDFGATTSKAYFLNDTFVTRSEPNGTGTRRINYGTVEFLEIKGAHSAAGNAVMVDNTASGVVTTFDTGTGPDSVFVDRTNGQGPLFIDGEDGNDRVTLASRLTGLGLREIGGPVTVLNDHGHTALTVNDSDDPVGRTATIAVSPTGTTFNSIVGLAAGELHFDNHLTSLVVSGGSGGNTFNVSGTVRGITTTLNTGTGINTANVLATFATGPLNLNAGGLDTVSVGNTVNGEDSIQALVTLANTLGCNLTVNDAPSVTDKTYTMDAAGIRFPLAGSPALVNYAGAHLLSLNLNGSLGSDRYNVLNTPGGVATTVNIGSGVDTANVVGTGLNSQLTLNGSGGNRTEIVNLGIADQFPNLHSVQAIHGVLTVNALSSFIVLNVDDSANTQRRSPSLFANVLTGLAPGDLFFAQGSLGAMNILIGSGGTLAAPYIFTVNDTPTSGIMPVTTLQTEANINDPLNPFVNQVDVLRTAGPLTIVGGAGFGSIDTVTVGSTFSQFQRGGSLQDIRGRVIVTRTAGFTGLNITDLTDPVGHTFSLDANAVHGLAPADIEYRGDRLRYFNVLAGVVNTGGNNVTILNTPLTAGSNPPAPQTTLGIGVFDTFTGKRSSGPINIIRVVPLGSPGRTPPTSYITGTIGDSGSVQGILGDITISTGGSLTRLTIDDSADAQSRTPLVTSAGIMRLAPANIVYTPGDLQTLTINSGSGGNTFQVASTPTQVATTINAGTGIDTINLGSALATDPVSTIDGIAGSLTVNGMAAERTSVNINDQDTLRGSRAGRAYVGLAAGNLGTWLRTDNGALSAAPISFQKVTDTLTFSCDVDVQNTAIDSNTVVRDRNGDAGTTDTFNIEATGGSLAIDLSGRHGPNTVNVSSSAANLDTIQGSVAIQGSLGVDTINIEDRTNPATVSYQLTATTLMRDRAAEISFVALPANSQLNLFGGQGDNTAWYVYDSQARVTTALFTSSNNSLNIQGTSGPVGIISGGNDLIDNSNANGQLAGIHAPVDIAGAGSDQLFLNDSGNGALGQSYTLTGTSFMGTGFANVTFRGLQSITVDGGFGSLAAMNIVAVLTGTPVTINTGTGSSVVTVGYSVNTLDGIADSLTINDGSYHDMLNFFDQASSTAHAYRLTSLSLARDGGIPMLFTACQSFTLNGSNVSGNTFNVTSTPNISFPVTTTLNLGTGGANTVIVGTDAGNLDFIGGYVDINGLGAGNVLILNDQIGPQDGYTLGTTTAGGGTRGTFTRSLSGLQLTYAGMQAVSLLASGGDGLIIEDTLPSIALSVQFGLVNPGGDNTIDVQHTGANSNVLISAGIRNEVTIEGTGANALLEIDTQGASNFYVAGNGAGSVVTLVGGIGEGSLSGPDGGPLWDIAGTNGGTLTGGGIGGVLTFSEIQTLIGGAGDDYFFFEDGARITGSIDGGGGDNTLDFSAFADAPVVVYFNPADRTAGLVTTIGMAFYNMQNRINVQEPNAPGGGGARSKLSTTDVNQEKESTRVAAIRLRELEDPHPSARNLGGMNDESALGHFVGSTPIEAGDLLAVIDLNL